MMSWLACCKFDDSGNGTNLAQDVADASAPPVLVSTDECCANRQQYEVFQNLEEECEINKTEDDSESTDSNDKIESSSEVSSAGSGSSTSSIELGACATNLGSKPKGKKKTSKFIAQGIGAFRKKMLTTTGPGAVEHDRGVFIEELYDFYDPSSERVRARKMTDNVIHRRRHSILAPTELSMGPVKSTSSLTSANMCRIKSTRSTSSARSDDETSSVSSGSSSAKSKERSDASDKSKSDKSASDRSKSSGYCFSAVSSIRSSPVLKRHVTKSNLELVATWGVLVGNVLHRLVLDFGALASKMLRERRYLAASHTLARTSDVIKTTVEEKAGYVVSQAMKLAKKVKRERCDQLDSEWQDTNLLSFLFSTQYVDFLVLFARSVAKLLHKQPIVAVALAPCHVFGDLHGQLRDLLLLFSCFGMPTENNNTTYVFNGDFVDRGSHQVEVIGLLLALKLSMPDRIWLVRGNHEDREMNKRYGFKQACLSTLGSEFGPIVFERIHQAFDELPLACLIEKKLLCVHGGIGDGTWTLDKLQTVKRPLTELVTGKRTWLGDILWSDPIEDGKTSDPEVFGVHESPRGKVGSLFAWNVTKTFCARNGLSLIIRSHQSKEGSPGFDVMHEHLLIRVFSARDYEDHGNDGAILKVEKHTEAGKELLKIRPSVLRSVTKTRDEASRRQKDDSFDESFESKASSTPTPARRKRARAATMSMAMGKTRSKRSSRSSIKEMATARRASTQELMGSLES